MIISVIIFIQQPEWANKVNQLASINYIFGLLLLVGLVFLFFKIPQRISQENKKSEIGDKVKTKNKDLKVKINNSKKCPKCSCKILKDDKFCGSCGEKLNVK
jgi:uncharacterized paraquat-inducible protein A